MHLCGGLSILWYCLSLGLGRKLTFSSPVATAEFSKFAGILSAALSQHHLLWFEIAQLNSVTSIPSPLLALFVVMLPKAHLTLHSRMSGSRWVITWLWLSGSWSFFVCSSSVYSCYLFLISSAPVRSITKLSRSVVSDSLWPHGQSIGGVLWRFWSEKQHAQSCVYSLTPQSRRWQHQL